MSLIISQTNLIEAAKTYLLQEFQYDHNGRTLSFGYSDHWVLAESLLQVVFGRGSELRPILTNQFKAQIQMTRRSDERQTRPRLMLHVAYLSAFLTDRQVSAPKTKQAHYLTLLKQLVPNTLLSCNYLGPQLNADQPIELAVNPVEGSHIIHIDRPLTNFDKNKGVLSREMYRRGFAEYIPYMMSEGTMVQGRLRQTDHVGTSEQNCLVFLEDTSHENFQLYAKTLKYNACNLPDFPAPKHMQIAICQREVISTPTGTDIVYKGIVTPPHVKHLAYDPNKVGVVERYTFEDLQIPPSESNFVRSANLN